MKLFDASLQADAGSAPEAVRVTVTKKQELTSEQAVRDWLASLSGDGWVCCTSEVRRWSGGPLPEGAPLQAEVALEGRAASVLLRRTGDAWTAWEVEEERGDEHRAVDVSLLSTEPGLRLGYRQYWEAREEGPEDCQVDVWRPIAARLCGWEDR